MKTNGSRRPRLRPLERGPESLLLALEVVRRGLLVAALAVALLAGVVSLVPGSASARSGTSRADSDSGLSADDADLRRTGRDSTEIRFAAGLANLLYTPTKVAYAGLGLVVGGLGGIFSGGDVDVALGIMQPSFRGDYLIRPAHLRGAEPILFVGRDRKSERSDPAERPEPRIVVDRPDREVTDAGRDPADSASADESDRSSSRSLEEAAEDRPSDDESAVEATAVAPALDEPGIVSTRRSATSDLPAESEKSWRGVADGSSSAQLRAILARRDEDEPERSTHASDGKIEPVLPAVSAPPPRDRGGAERQQPRVDVLPTSTSGPPSSAKPDEPDLGSGRVDRLEPRDDSNGEDLESGWPQPQVGSKRWERGEGGVWIYETP